MFLKAATVSSGDEGKYPSGARRRFEEAAWGSLTASRCNMLTRRDFWPVRKRGAGDCC